MPQSLSNIMIHLIWSTKDRRPSLKPGICEKTHAFLAGAVRQMDCEAFRVSGVFWC
jgi:REP element-mobilizing transposase RayT